MTSINTEYLSRCLETLEKSYELIKAVQPDSIEYEVYRNSLVKGFEMTLEQSGKLLRKKLVPYFASKKMVDTLSFKDLFRYALKYSLIDEKTVDRWFRCRNSTAHDYGRAFAEETLTLIDDFIADVKSLKKVIENE